MRWTGCPHTRDRLTTIAVALMDALDHCKREDPFREKLAGLVEDVTYELTAENEAVEDERAWAMDEHTTVYTPSAEAEKVADVLARAEKVTGEPVVATSPFLNLRLRSVGEAAQEIQSDRAIRRARAVV